jgi:uncharacterized Zn-finger protein
MLIRSWDAIFVKKILSAARSFEQARERGVHTTERNFVCPVGSKKFTSDETLKQHVSNCNSHKMQQCNYCNKAFARKDHLMKHIQGVHFKEQKYICQRCNKGYMSQGAMLQHVGKAHMEKNFECHKCSRKFATNVRLQILIQETVLFVRFSKKGFRVRLPCSNNLKNLTI